MNGNQIHVFKAPDGSTIRVNPHQIQAAGGDPMKAAMGQFSDKVQNGDVDMDKLFPSKATNMVDSVDTGVKKVKSLISDGSIDPDDKLVSLKGDNGRSYLYNKDLDEVYASDGSQVSLKTAIGQEIKNKAGDMDGVAAKDFGSGATTYAGRASVASAPPVTPPSDAMPVPGGESSQELMNLPKYNPPKLRVVQYRGDEISRDMIGKRAWAAARGIAKNGNGSGFLSGITDTDGAAAADYIKGLAKVDRPLASWFETHPEDFNSLAKYVGDDNNVGIDKSEFSALVRKVGSVKEALRQLGRRLSSEEIAARGEAWENATGTGDFDF